MVVIWLALYNVKHFLFFPAPGDFLHLQRTLTFSPVDSELTATVTVQDDVIVEDEEEFLVVVAAAPGERGVMAPQNTWQLEAS